MFWWFCILLPPNPIYTTYWVGRLAVMAHKSGKLITDSESSCISSIFWPVPWSAHVDILQFFHFIKPCKHAEFFTFTCNDIHKITRVSFLGAEACLLAGSARNAYHTKYRASFHIEHLSCTTLRKGVFAAGAALTLLSMMGSILYYWSHSKADTGGWEKHNNEGVGMTTSSFAENQQHQKSSGF